MSGAIRRAHVFAVDWLPSGDDVATGGGLRSLQIAQALGNAGFSVSISVPRHSARVRAIAADAPDRLRDVRQHDDDNQLDILRHVEADIVVWGWPTLRSIPFAGDTIHVNDLNGLQHFEIANGAAGVAPVALRGIVQQCSGCDLMLTGSAEQNGFWAGQLAALDGPARLALVPFALPATMRGSAVSGPSPVRRLHFTGNLFSWNVAGSWLRRVADWCERRGGIELHVVAGLDPGGATSIGVIDQLRALERYSCVHLTNQATFRAIADAYRPGSVALDLYDETLERRLAVPIRTVTALAHGVPVLTNVAGTFGRTLARAGAARLVGTAEDGLEAALDALADSPPAAWGAMSKAARGIVAKEFDEASSGAALIEGIDLALRARTRRRSAWQGRDRAMPKQGHVLVVSDEAANLREVRVATPLGAMYREGLIEGYTVWTEGRIVFSTRPPAPDPVYNAIWVQRRLVPDMALTLQTLRRPFVFDADDNLLVSPAYRERFPPEMMQSGRFLARTATVLTAPNARLVHLLQRHACSPLVHKAIVCPNLVGMPARPAMQPGEPRCVIWASSDMPALLGGYLDVVRAIRDFCRMSGLRLVCIGAHPPALLMESDVEVEHVGLLPYGAYLSHLASLSPAILVCPLEMAGDPLTQDFIDGKSDIKVLEAMATGLVGVYSSVSPYLETDLPRPILCPNTYRGWFEGLMRARRACLDGSPAGEMPPARVAAGIGLRPWAEAIARVQLAVPMRLSELEGALALTRSRYAPRLVTEDEFDAAWYLSGNPDVRTAIASGDYLSAYDHYSRHGHRERRLASADDQASPGRDQFWLNLAHTVSDLAQSVESRSVRMEEIKTLRAARRQARQPSR